MTPPSVKPGDLLVGKYRVERVIGTGGLGIVVAATHLALDRVVALKFLLPGHDSTPEAIARFHREARAAAKLRSDHVAQVLDVGLLETGAPYIVMEYLEGVDLSRLVGEQRLPLTEAVDYVLQALEAIGEAHAAGIVHRDLKPANLFRTTTPDGSWQIKVLDFGIAKMNAATAGSDYALTSTRGIVGSPLYMSPEQLESARDVDVRSDIWSLGAILYELSTGKPPFFEETLARLCVAILQQDPRPPSAIAPELPVAFDSIVLRCLSKERERRYATVAELARALAPFAPAHALEHLRRIDRLGQSKLGDSQTTANSGATGNAGFGATLESEAGPATARTARELSSAGAWGSSQLPAKGMGTAGVLALLAALGAVSLVAAIATAVFVMRGSAGSAEPAASQTPQPSAVEPTPSAELPPPTSATHTGAPATSASASSGVSSSASPTPQPRGTTAPKTPPKPKTPPDLLRDRE